MQQAQIASKASIHTYNKAISDSTPDRMTHEVSHDNGIFCRGSGVIMQYARGKVLVT